MKQHLLTFLLLFMALPMFADEYKQLTNLPTVYIETKNQAAVTTKKTFIDATSDSSGRTWISDLGVASCHDVGKPFTDTPMPDAHTNIGHCFGSRFQQFSAHTCRTGRT